VHTFRHLEWREISPSIDMYRFEHIDAHEILVIKFLSLEYLVCSFELRVPRSKCKIEMAAADAACHSVSFDPIGEIVN
jgi:hypothetical protein